MPGAQCARSLAGRKTSRTSSSSHHGHTGTTRHSPRNGFTVSFVLSPVIRIWLTPSSADNSTNLTPTSRRQDHTTSPSASALFVNSASASTASRPASVTIAIRPSVGRDLIRIFRRFDLVKPDSEVQKINRIVSRSRRRNSSLCKVLPAYPAARTNSWNRRFPGWSVSTSSSWCH
jgi:hypothetical protein